MSKVWIIGLGVLVGASLVWAAGRCYDGYGQRGMRRNGSSGGACTSKPAPAAESGERYGDHLRQRDRDCVGDSGRSCERRCPSAREACVGPERCGRDGCGHAQNAVRGECGGNRRGAGRR